MAEGKALAAEIAAKSPTALRFLKQSFNADTDHQAGLSNMAMSALEVFVPTRASRARGRSTRSVQPTSPDM